MSVFVFAWPWDVPARYLCGVQKKTNSAAAPRLDRHTYLSPRAVRRGSCAGRCAGRCARTRVAYEYHTIVNGALRHLIIKPCGPVSPPSQTRNANGE